MRKFKIATAILFLMLTTRAISPATAQSEMIDGTVTKVDQSASKITIKHGPIKKFDMDEGMTMVFRAEKPELLNGLKSGDRIRFVPDRINGQFTVTRIEKAARK